MSCEPLYWLGVFITAVGILGFICPCIYEFGRLRGERQEINRREQVPERGRASQ